MNDDLNVFVRHVLPELGDHEVYFVSASARNKYLTEEERRKYDLGRTEMFGRSIAHSKENFLRVVEELEHYTKTYRTRGGVVVPSKATVIYTNINPSNTIKSFTEFQKTAMQKIAESLVNGNESSTSSYFQRLDRKLMNEIQKATGKKTWIDIDFDVDSVNAIDEFTNTLVGVRYVTIKTKSGYHILVDRNTIHHNFHKDLVELNQKYCKDSGEIIVNSNAMVPTPGTYHGGHYVFIDWKRSNNVILKENT